MKLFVALNRDEAKVLFGLRDDALVWQHIEELCGSSSKAEAIAADDSLTDVIDALPVAAAQEGFEPLWMVFTGVRQLYQGDERIVQVVRPDVTMHVAEAAGRITQEQWAAWSSSGWEAFNAFQSVFAKAAETRGCVVYASSSS